MTREPTEMENCVAKAIKDDAKSNGGLGTSYLSLARAAIRAMREPTDAMEDIVWENQEIKKLVEEGTPPINAVWVAMIDAASPQEE